nr:hypothetical protein [Tanacetum cinerariifolium]
MFRATLKLPVKILETSFVAPANIQSIKSFMNKVGYQGVVDKVSAFYTKNLAQPWQTMFKVFNRCLTTRTSGHDQIKINILQLFHVVVNQKNGDYAALLWWDFMTNKFPNIPKRIDEDYHSIKDDVLLVSVYTTGIILVQGMLIPDAFLTEEIRQNDDFKEYEKEFMMVDVPMEQLQPVVSTHGMNKGTPRALRSPTVSASPQERKKRKQIAEESSSPWISLKEEENVIDEDEVIPKDETSELIAEFQNIDKCVPTIFDRERMEATLKDLLSDQFKMLKNMPTIWNN